MTTANAPVRIVSLDSPLGPVPVSYVDEVLSDAGFPIEAMGHTSFVNRSIQIRNGLPAIAEAHTLRHEWVHLMLWDFGATYIHGKREEMVCDVIATALLAYPVR